MGGSKARKAHQAKATASRERIEQEAEDRARAVMFAGSSYPRHAPPMSAAGTIEAHVERRRGEGKSDREIMRRLKRYVAREVFGHLVRPGSVPAGADLRQARLEAGLSLASVAGVLDSWPNRISELERGIRYDTALALGYAAMLANIKSTATGVDNAA